MGAFFKHFFGGLFPKSPHPRKRGRGRPRKRKYSEYATLLTGRPMPRPRGRPVKYSEDFKQRLLDSVQAKKDEALRLGKRSLSDSAALMKLLIEHSPQPHPKLIAKSKAKKRLPRFKQLLSQIRSERNLSE